jgi:hypothetical protein
MKNLLKLGVAMLCLLSISIFSCNKEESGGGNNGQIEPKKNCTILERVSLNEFKPNGVPLNSFGPEIAALNNGEVFFETYGDGRSHLIGLRNGKKKAYEVTNGGSILASNGSEMYAYNFKGLLKFNQSADVFQRIETAAFLAEDLAVAANGEVWGIYDKLYRYQPKSGKTLIYETYGKFSTVDQLRNNFVNGDAKYQRLAFSPDGSILYIAAGDKVIEWKINEDLKAFQTSANLKTYQLAKRIAFSELAVANTDGSLYVGYSDSGNSMAYFLDRSKGQFTSISTSDPRLISRTTDGVWAVFSNGIFINFKAGQRAQEVDFAAFTPCADDYRKETIGRGYAFINNSNELWVSRSSFSKGLILFKIKI